MCDHGIASFLSLKSNFPISVGAGLVSIEGMNVLIQSRPDIGFNYFCKIFHTQSFRSAATIPKVPHPPGFFFVTWGISASEPRRCGFVIATHVFLGLPVSSALLLHYVVRQLMLVGNASRSETYRSTSTLSDYQSLCQRQPSIFNLPPTFLVNAPCLYLPAFIRLPMWNL